MTRILTICVLNGAPALVVAAPSSADAIEIKTPKVTMPHVVKMPQLKTPQGGAVSPAYSQALTNNETNATVSNLSTSRPKGRVLMPKLNLGGVYNGRPK
jgi:hypothetical protein